MDPIIIYLSGPPYKCYHYSEQDRKHLAAKSEKQVCEGHGYVFSHGNDKMAPGCGGCWCCQPTGGKLSSRAGEIPKFFEYRP